MVGNIHVDGRAVIDGYAVVRGHRFLEDGTTIEAWFPCSGTGDSSHCFHKAERRCVEAGFTPYRPQS